MDEKKHPHPLGRFPHDHNCGIRNAKIGRILEPPGIVDLDCWGDITIFGERLVEQDRFHVEFGDDQIRSLIAWVRKYRPDLMPSKEAPVPKYRSLDDE